MKKYFVLLMLLITGSILMQSFQCQSVNMSTAKVKLKNQEYQEAIKYLKTELKEKPGNDEAKLLLADTYLQAGMEEELISHLVEIKGTIKDPVMLQRYQVLVYNVWVKAYNQGIAQYNSFLKTKDKIYADSALYSFDNGAKVKPMMVIFNRFKGVVYELMSDTTKAMEQYQIYIDKLQPEFDFAKNNGIFVGMPVQAAVKALGEPDSVKGQRLQTGDSILVQFFSKKSEEILYYSAKPKEELSLDGWRVNLPDSWIRNEKLNHFSLDLSPIRNLAQYQYLNGQKDKALENASLIANLDPADEDINTFLVSLYLELNRADEAISSIQELIKKDPNNKLYRTKFGDLYSNMAIESEKMSDAEKKEHFEKAIEQYEKALSVDPTYDLALRNVASAYKNIAAIIQEQEIAKADKDKTYEPDLDKYEPFLQKSADYFVRALDTERYKDDFNALNDLANIYMVMDEDTDLKQVVRKMEALEYSIDSKNDKLTYYYKLLKIYGDLKEKDKMQATQKKIEGSEK